MPTSRIRKLLSTIFVFVSLCVSAQAAEYYWIGGGADNNWTTVENWSTTEGATPGTGTVCPGDSDIVHIYGTVEVTINTAISIGKLLIEAGNTHFLDSFFTTTLSGTGSLAVTDTGDAINLTRCSDTPGVIGTLAINLPVTCKGTIQTHSGTTLEVNNELTTVNLVHSATDNSPQSLLKVNGKLNVSDTLNLNSQAGGATQLNVQSSKIVNAKKIIFGADDYNNTGVSTAIVNEGTIHVTEEFTIRNIDVTPYTGTGKIQLDGSSATFTNNYTGDSITIAKLECLQSCVISGDTTFTNITASNLGGKTLTINGTQTITNNFTLSGSDSSNTLTLEGTGSLSLTKTLIADSLSFTGTGPSISAGTAYASNSTGTPTGWIVVSGNQHVWNGGNESWGIDSNWLPQTLPQDTDDVIINVGTPVITSDVTVKSITLNGTSGITVTNPGSLIITDATAFNTNITGNGKYIVDSGKTHTVSDTKVLNINIENKGTIDITDSSLSATSFSGIGTINLSGGTTALKTTNDSTTTNTVVLKDTDATIQGNFEFDSFTAEINMGGKTITLNNASVKASSITLKGTGSTSLLSLEGSGSSCTFDTSSLDAQYLSIDSNIDLDNYTTAISDCVPTAGETPQGNWLTVIHHGWNIKSLTSFIYTWTGNTSNAWNTASNWDTGYIPATDCKIIIPSTTNKPVISDACTGGTITINSEASVTLGTANLVLSGNEGTSAGIILTNNGTIIYTGAGRITNNSSTPINDNVQGTVEYAAGGTPGTITDFSADTNIDDYCNLVISGTGWSLADTLKMQAITIGNGATCTVNSATTLRAQTFTFNGDSSNKNINASANLTLLPYVDTADLTVPSGIDSKFTISSEGTLHLGNASTNSIIFSNSDTFDSFEYKLNFHAPVTLNRNVTVSNTVTANANISGDGELIFAGAGEIIFTAGTYIHSNITINKSTASGSLTINGNCRLSNLKILNGKAITFADTPEITNYSDTATSGNLLFNNGATITSAFTRNSDGVTRISGTITAASVTLKDTTISGAASITTTSGTQTFTGTINGATSGADELTLAATSVTFNDNVGTTIGLKKLTVNAPLTIAETDKSISSAEIDFQGAISGSGKKLTVNTPIFKSTATTDNTITLSELELAAASTSIDTSSQKLTFSVSTISGTGKTIVLSSGSKAEFAAGITISPAVTNDGTITCSRAATFKGSYSGTGASLTLSNDTTIFESDLDLSGTTFTSSNGTVQIGGTSSDIVTIKGPPQEFYNFETTRSLKILGDNTFNNFTANTNMGGKSISFEAGKTQTVNGTLSLSGTPDSSLLILKNEGNGVWNITCSNPTISYVDVINSTSTNSIFAIHSKDSGHNINWNFPGMQYEWTGEYSTDPTNWNAAANWNPASVPGVGTYVTIPAGKSSYPKLIAPLNITNTEYSGTITIATNAQFDLADQSLTVGTITNNGLVRLKGVLVGTADQINGIVSNGIDSTVEYYDDTFQLTSSNLAWGTDYQNILIKKPANLDDVSLNVTGTTTIAAGTGKSVSLNNASNVFTGHVTIGDSAAATPVNAGAVTLKAGSIITLANNANADSLEVQSAVKLQNVTTSGNQTYSGTVETITGSATITSNTGNINFVNPINLGFQTDITATTGSISFGTSASIDGTQQLSLTSNGGTTFGADVGNTTALSALSVTGPLNINCGIIKTSGNQTYNGTVLLGVTSDHNHTLSGTQITFGSNATINGAENLTLSGTVNNILNANLGASTALASLTVTGPLQINCEQIKTTDNQTYNSTVSLIKTGNITLTAKNTSSNEYQTIQFDGNISCAASVTPNLILDANTIINCANVTTTGTQTYNGTIQLNTTASITSTTDSLIYNDTVSIASTVTDPISLIAATTNKEINFKKDITGTGKKLIINTPIFKSIAATSNNSNITLAELEVLQDTSIQSQNSAAISLTVPKISGTGKTVTLAASVSDLSFNGNVEFNPNITTVTGSHFKASLGTMTFKADINFANNSLIANNGTIILTAANKTPVGTAAILDGNNTFNNLTLQGPVILRGSNTISNLTAGDEATGLGGKTITFAATSTQTISGTLKLNGSSETSRLILRSSTAGSPWNILCQGTNAHSIHFVDISDSNNQSSYNLFAITSNDSGNNTKWNFPGMIYTWNGSTNDSWNTAANWTPSSIPGKGAEVRIAEVTSPASTLLLSSDLDLTDSYNGTNYNGTITVNAGAIFDLAENNLSVGTITNNGLVRLTGASTQTITAAMNNGAASTVEYYGAGATTSNFAWDGDNGSGSAGRQYENLIISRAISQNTDEENKLLVSGTTTIIAGSTNSVSLNNPYNIFSGHVILGNHSASISAGTVTLNGTGAGSVAIFLEENIFADNLTLNSNVRGDTLTFLTPLTVNTAQVSSTGTQTYNSPVSITLNANFVSGSGSLINFADTITGNGTASLTISNADSKFEGIVSNLSSLTTDANTTINANLTIDSLFTQTASLNCTAITTSGNQNYHGAVTLENSSLLTLTADNIIFDSTIDGSHPITFSIPDNPEKTISVAGIIGQTATPAITITQAGTVNFTNLVKSSSFEITKANSTTFNDTVEINTFIDTSDAGNISFKNGGTISNPSGTEFLTTGTVTFGDSSEDLILFGTSSTYANLTHTAGNTLIAGTLNANNITFTDAVLTDDTSIISQGTQNFTGTINDSTAGSHQLILNSNNSQITFTQNIGETTAPRILTVNGPSAINCQLVKTTESQTYNNAITGDDSISLESAVINLNCSTITTNGSQTFNGPTLLQSNTTLTSDTGNLHFTSTVNGSHKLTLAKANISTFDNTVEVTDFEITQAAATNFEATATIGSFTDSPSAGNISFKNGGTISSSTGTTFLTSGTVTLGNGADNTFNFGNSEPYANLTHTAGITSINGVINAACITLGETTGGQITLNNTDLFKTTDGSPLNYSTSFTQIGTANSILGGSFTGNGNASFKTNVLLYGTSPADFGTADKNININKNLIISRNSELTTHATLAITNNLVIYNGDITTNADISAADDILLLGNAYNTKDDTTGIEDEFVYTTPRHNNWSQPNYTATELPDGSTLPTDYSGTLSVATGKTILAGKNLYINGSTMALAGSTGQWNLSLSDISDPSKAFAEAYYTSINGCKVILHSSDSNVSDSAKEDGTYARLAALECTDNGTTNSQNQNIEFEDFMITNAFTVRDNAIRVEFNQPIRYHTTTIGSLNFHDSSDSPEPDFTGFYSDPDCTPEHELKSDIQLSYLNPDDNKTYYYFYIKAASQDSAATGAWNTDATGKSIGAENEKSSDRDGIHHATFPCLDFPRSLKKEDGSTLSFIITDRWGKRLNNYSKRPSTTAIEPAYGSTNSSKEVADKTGPVLWSVRTGQELHTAYNPAAGAASQHSYDSHNFLEFRYSEPVEFYEQNNLRTITENFQVTDELGAIAEDITSELNTITFAGLAKLNAASGTSLKLHTGIQGMVSKYTNALYRTDEYSVRISIAGWTDGTVTDYSGDIYKKWPGYIETASQFTNATVIAFTDNNSSIKDLNQNNQIEYAAGCRKEPVVLSDSSGNHTANLIPTSPDLYSKWDLSEPYFTPLRNSVTSTITASDSDWSKTNERSEAIGNTNGTGSTLDRIDFHFFDNTPNFDDTDEAEWFTEVGWCLPGTSGSKSNLKDSSYTYAADIIGGARQFDTISSRRTSGGIRFSTKLFASPGFKYSTDQDAVPETPFATGLENVHSTVVSQLFTGSSEPRHAANDPDGLYLGLGITDTALPVETTFAFSYNESTAYLTDLAGNRLRSKTSKTIDRTPPSFDIILSPVNQNQIYIVFVKQIVTSGEGIRICDADGNPQTVENNLLALLPDCFQLVRISENGTYTATDENDITIDSSVPASIIEQYSDNHFTCICLRTTRNITFDDVRNLHIQLKNHKAWPEKSQDPFTSNKNARVTFIQDGSGNYMPMYSAHALSDFAINYVNPLYAYSSDITEDENPVMDGLYENGSWAVHNWNADQNKYGTLPSEHSAAIVTALEDNSENATTPDIRVYLSDSPDRDSVSKQFNKDFKTSLRVWLPELSDGIFRALTATNNSNFSFVDSELLTQNNQSSQNELDSSNNLIFNIPLEMIQKWKSGDQISFMFGITNTDGTPVRIYNNPYFDIENNRYDFSHNIPVPLYSLRMHDTTDIGTLDLWSFRLKGITGQRGGVTILNNVINAANGEKTVIKVDVPAEGKLNVIVMTLDGNIITYLHRGNAKTGENYFTWDGKNRSGSAVARGMYFIRVVGTDFDETRKVMVVK